MKKEGGRTGRTWEVKGYGPAEEASSLSRRKPDCHGGRNPLEYLDLDWASSTISQGVTCGLRPLWRLHVPPALHLSEGERPASSWYLTDNSTRTLSTAEGRELLDPPFRQLFQVCST